MKSLPTLYLLAADQDYRLLHSAGTGMAEIVHRQASDFPDVDYEFSRSQGRNQTGAGAVQFNIDGRSTEDEQERTRFAAHVVAALEAEWGKGNYDRIVISAGPKMLGALRDAMPKAMKQHVAAELHKDLVKIPAHDLPSHFKDVTGL